MVVFYRKARVGYPKRIDKVSVAEIPGVDIVARLKNQGISGVGCAPVGPLADSEHGRVESQGERREDGKMGYHTYAQSINANIEAVLLVRLLLKAEVKRNTFFDTKLLFHPSACIEADEKTQSQNHSANGRHAPGEAIAVGRIVEVCSDTRWWLECGCGKESFELFR